jgi:hypothetical protein
MKGKAKVHVATALGWTITGIMGEPVATQTETPACTATGMPITVTRAEPTTHCPVEQNTPVGVREHAAIA